MFVCFFLNSGYLYDPEYDEVLTVKSAEMVTIRANASQPPPSPQPPWSAVQPPGIFNEEVNSGNRFTTIAREQSVGILFTNKSESVNTDNEGWQQVMQKKRSTYHYNVKMAVASELNGHFKAAEKRIPIFICNVHKDTLTRTLSLKKIVFKIQKDHLLPVRKMPLFLDEKLWPGMIRNYFPTFCAFWTTNWAHEFIA